MARGVHPFQRSLQRTRRAFRDNYSSPSISSFDNVWHYKRPLGPMSVAPSHTLQATANVTTRFIESRGNFKIFLQLLENMVAREGAEAPTPAFSEPILTVIAST